MKHFILLLFVTVVGYGQDNLNFQSDSINYLELLNVSAKGALVIQSGKNIDNNTSVKSFLILSGNGRMTQYGIFYVNGARIVQKYDVDESLKSQLIEIPEKIYSIEPYKLNIVKDENNEEIYISDGTTYSIVMLHDNKETALATYAPEVYIENKYPGFEQREKLMHIVKVLDVKNRIQSVSLDSIAKAEAVYLKADKILRAGIEKDGAVQIGEQRVLFDTKGKVKSLKPDIVYNNRNQIIDLDFFLKYGNQASSILKSKKIFLIESENNKEVKVIEVNILFFLMI